MMAFSWIVYSGIAYGLISRNDQSDGSITVSSAFDLFSNISFSTKIHKQDQENGNKETDSKNGD